MIRRYLVRAGGLGLLVALLGLTATGGSSAQEMVSYSVTIENLTDGQPFTPPVVVAHADQFDLFEMGQAASAEVQAIAENGNNDPLVEMASSSPNVFAHTVGTGPVMPGESATLTIQAPSGSYLSALFMLICTNDGFSGLDALMLPASGSVTVDADAYDAGTEQNTEDFADIVPPCQGLIGVSSGDEGTGMSNPALAEGGVISMHAGIEGGTDLTVADHGWTDPVARIMVTTVADDKALPSAGTGLADDGGFGVWLIYLGTAGAALFVLGGAFRLARSRVAR